MQVVLVHSRDDGDHGEGVAEGLEEDMGEEINRVGQDMWILADEDDLVLKHDEGQQFEEGIEGEHAEDGEDPVLDKEGLCLVPKGTEINFPLVNHLVLVLLAEVDLLELKLPHAVIEKLDHPLQLKLTVSLPDGQLDIFFVVVVHHQSLHFDEVDWIPDDLLEEGEEGVVCHYAEYTLGYAYFEVGWGIYHVLNRFVRLFFQGTLMAFALDFRVGTRNGTTWTLNVSKRYIGFAIFGLNSSVVMNTNTNAEESFARVDMVQQIIVVEMVVEVRVRTFEIEDKTLKICVAVRHDLHCLFFGLQTLALLDCHPWGEDQLGCLHFNIIDTLFGEEDVTLELFHWLSFKNVFLNQWLFYSQNWVVFN